MSSYHDYYSRTIEENNTGIKLVLGGTGLGKTSSIPEIVHAHPERKFIYVANRLRLLQAMENEFRPSECIRIPRDLDQVLEAITLYGFDELLDSQYAEAANRASPGWLNLTDVMKAVEHIRRIAGEAGRLDLYEFLADDARLIMQFFRYIAQIITAPSETERQVLETLFPMMRFIRDEKARIAVVSLHKLFYGVFDGQNDIDISSLSGYVVFLDEFDFLEQDLLDLLCKSPEIDNLFEFVAPFSRIMNSQLPFAGFAQDHQDLRRRLEQITETIQELQNAGLDFPNYTRCFLMPGVELPEHGARVFQTRFSVTRTPMRIWQTDRGFEIAPARDVDFDHTHSLTFVLGTLHTTSRRILSVLKEYKRTQHSIYEELRWQCYGSSRSTYYRMVERIGHFQRSVQLEDRTSLDSLLATGFDYYDVEHMNHQLVPDGVEIQNISMYTTPERMLYELASQNLIFGLSATADIRRCLHHFDTTWLREQPGINWVDLDERDRRIIQDKGQEKQEARQNQLHSHRLPPLQTSQLLADIDRLANQNPGSFAEHNVTEHHRNRLSAFFSAMEWMTNHDDNAVGPSHHLMFASSYRQIKALFTTHAFRDGGNCYQIRSITSEIFDDLFDFEFAGHRYRVLFLNAKVGRKILESNQGRDAYNALFNNGRPVIVITQYASAGAGVNLQYGVADDVDMEERDFTHIYFLDLPFYFFAPNGQRNSADRKKNVWQLAKLFHSKQISTAEFERLLGITNGSVLSSTYQAGYRTSIDATLNQLAIIIQALGRIERTWISMPDQHVIMVDDVLDVLERYLFDEEFESIRDARHATNSPNLQALFSSIPSILAQRNRRAWQTQDRTLSVRNTNCRSQLGSLLEALDQLRRGESREDARETWEALRERSLQHDFEFTLPGHDTPLLEQYNMTYRTDKISRGYVRISSSGSLLTPDSGLGQQWWLDAVYDLIRENEIIARYFNRNGYETAFSTTAGVIFVPYAFQSILTGAIGEAAITALLEYQLGRMCLEPLPNALFETVDLKLKGLPIFIDAKNYSEQVLIGFGYDDYNDGWHPRLNSDAFRSSAARKLEQIEDIYGPQAQLVYINLLGSSDRGTIELYDAEFHPVDSLSAARIFVVQGALNREVPNTLTHGMDVFLDYVSQLQGESYE